MLVRRLVLLAAALLHCGVASAQSKVVAITLDGMIHPITSELVGHALEQAKRENAKLVLIRLNTPGGLLDATRHITEQIVASPVPVAAYVTPSGGRAASAGFFILQAADIAAMAPGTNTGAASPVLLGGKMDPVMRRKAESDASAALRTIVQKRSRNSQLAEKAVLEAKAFTEKEALDDNLIDLIATSEADLVEKLNGREIARFDGSKQKLQVAGATIEEYSMTRRERLISSIADPNIAFVLLILGALGIYVEFSAPGMIVPGVAGAISVLLGLSALSVLPINWIGAALLVLALTLFILEAKFASHGVLGVGGAVAMVLGALLLVEGPPEIRIHLSTALAVTLPFAAITIFLVTLVVRARSNKIVTGSAGMIGELGFAYTALNPSGKVFIHGEYWDAIASTPIEAGARVQVTALDGLTVEVAPVSTASRSPQ